MARRGSSRHDDQRTRAVPLGTGSRRKTRGDRKLGYVARAAAVYRVDRLTCTPTLTGRAVGDGFVETVLRYAVTPPHLRKEVWGHRDELEYVGVLPPLLVSSTTGSESDDSGSLQQGIVTEVGPDGRVRVNCGMQHPISLYTPSDMMVKEGERVAIRVSSRGRSGRIRRRPHNGIRRCRRGPRCGTLARRCRAHYRVLAIRRAGNVDPSRPVGRAARRRGRHDRRLRGTRARVTVDTRRCPGRRRGRPVERRSGVRPLAQYDSATGQRGGAN